MTISAAFCLQNVPINADVVRQAISSLMPDGPGGLVVSGSMIVAQTTTPSMAVTVGPGRAWIEGTNVAHLSGMTFGKQGKYFVLNDAPFTVNIATSDPTNPRVDLIYVAIQDSVYSGTQDQPVIAVATGVPAYGATYPANAPTPPANSLVLAYVLVGAGVSTITNSNITMVAQPYTQPVLTPVNLASGYIPRAANYPTPSVYKANSRAYLTGSITFNANGTWNAGSQYVIATLPSQFIPAASQDYPLMFRVTTGFVAGFITVDHTGNITITPNTTVSSNNPTISLEGLSWPQP